MQADIHGSQRKILSAYVRPARAAHGASGIALKDGRTLPFTVVREWSAPEGYYPEQWFLVDPATQEVLFEGPVEEALIWGLQARTERRTEVEDQIALAPGTYQIVFALGGLRGGDIEVEASEAPAEEAA